MQIIVTTSVKTLRYEDEDKRLLKSFTMGYPQSPHSRRCHAGLDPWLASPTVYLALAYRSVARLAGACVCCAALQLTAVCC